MQFDAQAVRVLARDLDHTLSGAAALMAGGGKRREAYPLETAAAPAPIIGFTLSAQQCQEALQRVGGDHGFRARCPRYETHQFMVAQGLPRHRAFGVEPAGPAMPGGIDPKPVEQSPDWSVLAVFHPLPIPAHIRRAPGRVARQARDPVPIAVMRRDKDHRIVAGAAAERASPRIENPAVAAFWIAPLSGRVGVMLDKKVPPH